MEKAPRLVVYTHIENIPNDMKAPRLLDLLPQLAPAEKACFPVAGDEKEEDDLDENEQEYQVVLEYAREMMSMLHPNYEEVDEDEERPTSSSIEVYDVCYKKQCKRSKTNETYAFCVLFGEGTEVLSSCLLEMKLATGECEVHSVCAMEQGKGACKSMIERVIDYVFYRRTDCTALTIYCENSNLGACGCYRGRFAAWMVGKEGQFVLTENPDEKNGKPITRWWIKKGDEGAGTGGKFIRPARRQRKA